MGREQGERSYGDGFHKRIDGMYLKQPLASLLILTALIRGAAAKTDVMLVLLEDGDWEKTKKEVKKWIPTGTKSLHHQPTDHEDCVDLLDRLKQGPVILTLRNSTAVG
jgi:hypothetical protein